MYQLTIDYADETKQDISGNALQFHVSDDERYRNESYGFLAVVKAGTDSSRKYEIETFSTETGYWDWLESSDVERSDVLLEFQGVFQKQKTDDGSIAFKGVSNSKTHNVMTMNGTLDIRNGTCTITEKNGSVKVDFDADIYTTGTNTYVHTGVAALTELEAGNEYNLIPYSENGDREDMAGEPIALLWPSAGEAFQNLMGLLFNLKYGELGAIYHEDAPSAKGEETRIVGFGAALDLSFLIPSSVSKQMILGRTHQTKSALGSSWEAAEHNSISFSADEIRALNKQTSYKSDTANTEATELDIEDGRFTDMTVDDTPGFNTASIVIDDILFGGGDYLGLNLEVALGLPPYIQNLPALECVLTIHTVGEWSFGVDGQCHFGSFQLQAGLDILSKDGAPIVDRMSFFLGGITPGFNVDGMGVLWLQGATGGIENIYDTIFLTEKIPPIKLIIGAQFSVLQVFSAYAIMGLSLRGVELTLTNGQFLEYTDEQTGVVTRPQPITMDGSVKLDWWPEFYFHAAVNLALAMTIRGSGYIVGEADGFYEFFIRASLSIPSDIPIIGGYEIAGMGMGVNTNKVWGRINYLSVLDIGVTYYWGGDIDWNSGSDARPTYPELLGDNAGAAMMVMPVDYDAETGRTLYMALGTNMRMSAAGRGFAGGSGAPVINDLIYTEPISGASHTMKLEKNGSGKILSIQWTCEDEAEAKAAVENISIVSNAAPSVEIPIKLWSKENPDGANANFSYDPETDTAYLSIAFAADDAAVYGVTWDITTMEGAHLVVYDVAPMPEITIKGSNVSGRDITLELDGYNKEVFTKLSVVAEGKNSGQTYLLGSAVDPFEGGAKTLNLVMPEQAISDTYTIRIVASDDKSSLNEKSDGTEAKYYDEVEIEVIYTNPNQPAKPTEVSAENAGNYTVDVAVIPSGDCDGYSFTVYDAEGKVVNGMSGILMNKDGTAVTYDENGYMIAPESAKAAAVYTIGGHYEQTLEGKTVVSGFSAGEYTIEVRSWKKVNNGGAALLSEPASTTITVREPINTQVSAIVSAVNGGASHTQTIGSVSNSYELTTYASSDLIVQLTSTTESFTGTWRVDGGFADTYRGEITEGTKSASVLINDLTEGQHVFTFLGKNQYGDTVSFTKQFAVDTQGPRMMLSAPVNGSLFEYWTGELEISGVTDQNVSIAVVDNTTGETVLAKTALTMDEEGAFTQKLALDRTILIHELTITLYDKLGNESTRDVSVMSNGLGSIEELMLYAGDQDVTNTKLTAGGTYALP